MPHRQLLRLFRQSATGRFPRAVTVQARSFVTAHRIRTRPVVATSGVWQVAPIRRKSTGSEAKDLGEIVSFEEIKTLVEKNDASGEDYRLIDVREVHEVMDGRIPTAMCLPVDLVEEAFKMDPKSFERKYGFPKPGKTDHVIFYCRSGKRSTRAAEAAKQAGFS
ncbi:hypothetical protein HDU96_002379, partial [Phlyctochytrium bullatum]